MARISCQLSCTATEAAQPMGLAALGIIDCPNAAGASFTAVGSVSIWIDA